MASPNHLSNHESHQKNYVWRDSCCIIGTTVGITSTFFTRYAPLGNKAILGIPAVTRALHVVAPFSPLTRILYSHHGVIVLQVLPPSNESWYVSHVPSKKYICIKDENSSAHQLRSKHLINESTIPPSSTQSRFWIWPLGVI